jgi:hypothetical protein
MEIIFRKLSKFRALSWRDQKVLLTAMLLLPLFWLALRVFGLSRFQIWLNRSPVITRTPLSFAELMALGTLVNIAGNHTPSPVTCLTRSLLLGWFLHRRGVTGELRIGVRLLQDKFDAHAWVEYAGKPINDAHDVAERFAAFNEPLQPESFSSP